MGRNKLVMKKIENSTSRQLTYSKRKDSIVKKANELAVLCDTDVALLMFSPTGQVTSYSSRGSVEDIMLRIVNRPGSGRYYEPQVENINSVHQAVACQQYLTSALERIQHSKAKLLGGDEFIKRNVAASVNTEDTAVAGNRSAYSNP
ncbi:hypothetical protein RND71_012257 [Anisodus tanguticus]|uniref:MADS-box domain-containing protein n=1 Tax=Anisodus tanguticus TaxID=243964 RepID=A0AAE1SET9_9SOLA|nr:hypothetical protein RND71_012257 [Anisodus tanguticus]